MTEPNPTNDDKADPAKALLDAVCPNCQRKLKVPLRKVGFKIHCPVCKGVFRVRGPAATAGANATLGDLPGHDRAPATGSQRIPEPQPGELFANRFEIVRRLGTGTFGSVYHAFDKRDYCDVALKVPSEDILFNPQFMERFRAEAAVLQRMRHPNIVTFYDAQLDSSPRFLVAELIKGKDLEQEIIQARKAGRWIDRNDALTIVEKLARALHHAHKKNVIHRDVKPANIMIAGEVVKLTDFGLARIGDPNMTQAGTKIGTPFYMSPEQVSGDPSRVDARSDQYALAVVLYELLCKRRPFDGTTAEVVYMKIVHEAPPSLTAIDSTIPADLAEVCLKGLAKNPADRWPHCDAFATALLPHVLEEFVVGSRHATGSLVQTAADDATGPAGPAITTDPAGALTSTVVDPVAKGLQPMASRISETISRGKSTLEPLTSSVQPLGKSLATTVKLGTRTIKSRWPKWVQWFFGALTGWVDQLNDNLSRIESGEHEPDDDEDDDEYSEESSRSAAIEGAAAPTPPPLASALHARSVSTAGGTAIPLASIGPARSTQAGAAASSPHPARAHASLVPPTHASRAASQAGEPGWPSYLDSIQSAHKALREHRRDDAAYWLDICPVDRRGWEWAYLHALCRSPIVSYTNHAGEISALAFDRSGRLLATGDDKGVIVWDTSTHRMYRRLSATLKRVDTVAFSPDGRWLAASGGKTIRLYDLEAPAGRDEPVHVLQGHDALVNRVTFAADGIHLASASLDQSIRIWNVREGIESLALRAKAGPVHTLLMHPYDPERLVSSHGNGILVVWDWAEACEVRRGTAPTGAPVDTLAIHPNGRWLVTGARDGALAYLELETLALIASVAGHAGQVSALAFDPSGRWLVSLGNSKERSIRVGVADPSVPPSELGREVVVLPFGATSLTLAEFSPAGDGRMALAGGRDEAVKLWDAGPFWASLATRPGGDRARAVAIHPGGSHSAVARLDGSIEVKNLAAVAQPRVFPGRGVPIHALAFHPRQLVVASAGDDGSVTFWDIVGGEPITHMQAHPRAVLALSFDPEGQLLATAGADGSVRIFDAQRHTLLHTLAGHGDKFATAVAFASLRGQSRLYSGGVDRLIHIWDPRTGERVGTLEEHKHKVIALAASADGRQVASLGEDRALIVWSTDRREPLLALRDIDVLTTVAWHQPTGSLAAVCEDRSLILETLSQHHGDDEDD
jgi:WD40 repeat protein/serine/threonine protein kinase